MPVEELEAWHLYAEFLPETPNAEVCLPHVGIVKDYDAAPAQLPAPSFEVVPDGLVRVQPIDVEQIDATVGKMIGRKVEGCSDQSRKRPVSRIVILDELFVYVFAVLARLGISLP